MEAQPNRRFKIKTMDGKLTDFELDSDDCTIPELKAMIESKMNIPVHRQRLIYKSRLLKDETKLSDYIQKDDEIIHIMAMSEEQAQERSQRSNEGDSQRNTRQNMPGNPNLNANPQANPFANIMGLLNNVVGNIGGNTNQASGMPGQFSSTIDLTSVIADGANGSNPISMTFSSNNNGLNIPGFPNLLNPTQNQSRPTPQNQPQPTSQNQPQPTSQNQPQPTPQNQPRPTPNQTQHVSSTHRVTLSSNTSQRTNPNPTPTPTTVPTANRRNQQEEEKKQNVNNRPRPMALPHNHLYNTNRLLNELMGPNSNFPGPPLPPLQQQRTPVVILGGFLGQLNFTMSRLLPYISRSGELLTRERNMVNAMDRAETQQMINLTGRSMEEMGRALILSGHYYRDLRLGEEPTNYSIMNNPHEDFRQMHEIFLDQQFNHTPPVNEEQKQNATAAPDRSQAAPTQNINVVNPPNPLNSGAPNPVSGGAQDPLNLSNLLGLGNPNQNPPPLNLPQFPFRQLTQNMATPEGMNNLSGIMRNIANLFAVPQNQQNAAQNTNNQNPSPAASRPPTQPQSSVDVPMPEDRKQGEEQKVEAENRQQRINQDFMTSMNNLASDNNSQNPLSQLVQSFMPAISNSSGSSNPLSNPIGDLLNNEREQANSFFSKVLVELSIQDLLAFFNGNYDVLTSLHPKVRKILVEQYMDGQDTSENREEASRKIAKELNDSMFIPDNVQQNVVEGTNPMEIAKGINTKHTNKIVNAILDISTEETEPTIFINRIQTLCRWWIGELIDGLKPNFKMQLVDVIKVIRANIEKGISSVEEPQFAMFTGFATDHIMKQITSSYSNYLKDKKKEDEAEAREMGISLDELYKRRRDSEQEPSMDVDPSNDEEPKIQEESPTVIKKTAVKQEENRLGSSQPPQKPISKLEASGVKYKTGKPAEESEKDPIENEKDPEVRKMIETIAEDHSMLVVNPPSKRPRSRVYKSLDRYFPLNIESEKCITEVKRRKTTCEESLNALLKQALKDSGFSQENIGKIMENVEISEDFIEHYKKVLKEEISLKKKTQEYKPGQFPELDRL